MFSLEAKEVVVVGDDNEETNLFLETIRSQYNPSKVILFKDGDNLAKVAPWTETQTMLNGKPTAYVCKDFVCSLPTNDLKLALKQLAE